MAGRQKEVIMPNEVTPWRTKDCSLTLKTIGVSQRETFSREINESEGEGGGLNANYRTVEAVAKVANILGLNDFRYGEDFIFKTGGDEINFDFSCKVAKDRAEKILRALFDEAVQ